LLLDSGLRTELTSVKGRSTPAPGARREYTYSPASACPAARSTSSLLNRRYWWTFHRRYHRTTALMPRASSAWRTLRPGLATGVPTSGWQSGHPVPDRPAARAGRGEDQAAIVGKQAAGRVDFFLHVEDFGVAYALMGIGGRIVPHGTAHRALRPGRRVPRHRRQQMGPDRSRVVRPAAREGKGPRERGNPKR
jgi:hypothetical protein